MATPVVPEDTTFVAPMRRITMDSDLSQFRNSPAYGYLIQFLEELSKAVQGRPNSAECEMNDLLQNLVDILKALDTWIDEIPPTKQAARFGNKAFKTWYQRVLDVRCFCTIIIYLT